MNLKDVLFYSRPHDMRLHLALARRIREDVPTTRVRFATFFRRTVRFLKEAGFEATYLPDVLRAANPRDCSDARLTCVEREAIEGSGGANLRLMLQAERFLPADGSEADRFLRRHVLVLDDLVRPGTWSIGSMYDHFVYWLAGSLANARGGRHYGMVGCAVPPNRTVMLRTPWEMWRVEVPVAEADRLLEESIRAQDIPVERRIAYMGPPPKKSRRGVRYYLDTLQDTWADRAAGSYFAHHWLTPLRWAAEKLLPPSLYRRLFLHPEPRYDLVSEKDVERIAGPFVYLALHMEPEATLLMYSPWCRDQLEAARLVSQAMPMGWMLVIKENPKMRGMRPPAWYRRLRALSNALLADPGVPSTLLARSATATVSIAGNASLEARLLGRPGICLGRPPFRRLLTAADFSSTLRLTGFFDLLMTSSRESVSIPTGAWRDWVAGTAPVSLGYVSHGAEVGFPDDAETADRLWRFMRAAVEPPPRSDTAS